MKILYFYETTVEAATGVMFERYKQAEETNNDTIKHEKFAA